MEAIDYEFIRDSSSVSGTIEQPNQCDRLDIFVSNVLGHDVSRTKAAELVDLGVLEVNGIVNSKASKRLRMNDTFRLDLLRVNSFLDQLRSVEELRDFTDTGDPKIIKPQDLPLKIVAEDENLLIIDKPSGQVVHPASGNLDGTLVNAIAGYFKSKNMKIPTRVGLVNRLDKSVSGIMIIAKNNKSLSYFGRMFEGLVTRDLDNIKKYKDLERLGRAEKYYRARVEVKDPSNIERFVPGVWMLVDGYIYRNPKDRTCYKFIEKDEPDFDLRSLSELKLKRCISFIRNLESEREDSNTLDFEIRLVTGRTHQIRAQLSSFGLPVLGDMKYGSTIDLGDRINLDCWKLIVKYEDVNGVLVKDLFNRQTLDGSFGMEELYEIENLLRDGDSYICISKKLNQ